MGSGGKLSHDAVAVIPSGFPAYRWHMVIGFVGLSVLYFGTIAYFDVIRNFLQLPPSGPKLCKNIVPDGQDCWRADLFAFELVSGLALVWAGVIGFWEWHVQKGNRHIPLTPEGRLFGYIPAAHHLTALGTTFQIFDLFISLLIPKQRQFLFLCHHIMAATVSWYGLNNQVCIAPCHKTAKRDDSKSCFLTHGL